MTNVHSRARARQRDAGVIHRRPGRFAGAYRNLLGFGVFAGKDASQPALLAPAAVVLVAIATCAVRVGRRGPALGAGRPARAGGLALRAPMSSTSTTGRVLFSRRADRALIPASNEKIYTTGTALLRFGAAGRLRTAALSAVPLDDVRHADRVPVPARRRRPDLRQRVLRRQQLRHRRHGRGPGARPRSTPGCGASGRGRRRRELLRPSPRHGALRLPARRRHRGAARAGCRSTAASAGGDFQIRPGAVRRAAAHLRAARAGRERSRARRAPPPRRPGRASSRTWTRRRWPRSRG